MKTQAEILDVVAEFERGGGGTWRYPRFFAAVSATCDGGVGGGGDVGDGGVGVGGGGVGDVGIDDTVVSLGKEDTEHAARVLRMRDGDFAIVCDGNGTDYLAQFCGGESKAVFRLIAKRANTAEPSVAMNLFMSALKSDRNEFVVQKAVELGAVAVTPTITKNCVAVPEPKSRMRKAERYRRVAYEAAKQCGRGVVPTVHEYADFNAAIDGLCVSGRINPEKMAILFYECSSSSSGGKVENLRDLADTLENAACSIAELAVFIGSEGGYTSAEVAFARERGVRVVNLGRRILRADTAPVVALTLLSYLTKNV